MTPVEGRCFFVKGVDQRRAYAGDLSGARGAKKGIAQEARAKASPVQSLVDGQPANDHDRDGIGHIAADAAGRVPMHDSAVGEAVIGNDLISLANNVSARSAGQFVPERPAPEPFVENWSAAIERR